MEIDFKCRLKMFNLFWCGIMCLSTVSGYNLDTKFPKIFSGSPGDYFGFTVALHGNREGPMALVGAPRANSSILSELHQPGVLFSCGITTDECREIVLDGRGNTPTHNGNEFSYYDKKDDMWLGVSLDIQQHPTQNDIVTCGHLWKNQYYGNHYLTNGVCYTIDSDLDPYSVKKMVPLVSKSKQAIIPPGFYYYAFGQAGTSATYSEDGKHLLLGAPGVYDWSGTVISYSSDPASQDDNYASPIIPDPPGNLSPESYIGYSVTSGKFYDTNDIYIAAGAPRDGGSHGRVYIFKALKPDASKIFVHQQKEGIQFGEYFGAAVLGVDLNNDENTDLLVGSPFASSDSGGDEGKVYIYISNGMGLQEYAQLLGGNKANSRFGTAIANVGDLNQDGYNDVVIGAPYEDGNGAVYIYHGSRNGINKQYIQRILAASIDPTLSGFGIHISRGLDIDSNRYPDVLVGAYSSSHAVLFRTRPVIQVFPELIFNPKQINTNVTTCVYQGENISCVNVAACLWYNGKNVPLTLEFENEVFVEHPSQTNLISPRAFFLQVGKEVSVVQQKSSLEIGINKCIRNELYIRPDIKDVITPIQILFRYKLADSASYTQVFNKSFPFIDPQSLSNITSSITFQTGCGRDDKCLSDLVVKATVVENPKNVPLIIGKNATLTLLIEVRNKGEPAYLSELLIHLPPDMPSINQDFCSNLNDQQNQRSNASLICDLGNPLLKGKEVTIQIKLDVTKIPTNKKKVNIYLEASTASTEINPSDNDLKIPIVFKAISDISITGTPAHEQIPYDEDMPSNVPISISHTYFVMNHGPSPLHIVDIILYVPRAFQGNSGLINFLTFTSLEADSGKPLTIPAKCNDTYLQIKPIMPDVKNRGDVFSEDELVVKERNNSGVNAGKTPPLNKPGNLEEVTVTSRTKKSTTVITKKRKDIVINCETAECIAIQCSASPFQDTRKFARITISAVVNISMLNNFLEPWYRIEFITKGEVFIRNDQGDLQPKQNHPDKIVVKTIIVHPGPPPSEEIAQWIIFVSIGVGVLLLLIILILLIKFGFFKRKQKEKMEEMLTEADAKDCESCDELESNEKMLE